MAEDRLIDHSPQDPCPSSELAHATNLVLIDNYDSFTWNVYQYLVLEGAAVTVYRNDEIALATLIALNPTQLVLSPGPGHPDADTGISCDAIRHFSGKIPILGVCMGEQCIFSVFGGRVDVTGEILHGKTSPLSHDGKGVYAGLPQGLPVTRYHSLAGTHATLPDCLEVSSWIATGPDCEKGVIMGVRHKTLLVEGVQFHPESILTAEGRIMLRNFLAMQGGTWAVNQERQKQLQSIVSENVSSQPREEQFMHSKTESILEKIYRHRRIAVEAQKKIPSQRPQDLQELYDLGLAPPLIPFVDRLRASVYPLSLMAEIKRASPSKGIISMGISAPAQARKYAIAGASVVSVLTEPEWFKGSIDDLRAVRQSLAGMPNRPAILRKDFIFEEYQILEARLAGADSVLLIVKMLELSILERLYKYCQSIQMEPLVEVNTKEEMEVAIKLGAKAIGVNNRNLATFEVDLNTTSRLMETVPNDTIVCALSGISGSNDVEAYKSHGVGGVLVGEALMRAADVTAFVSKLLGPPEGIGKVIDSPALVKICGTRTPEAALAAIEAGADMIGIILVQGRQRCVTLGAGLAISAVVHGTGKGERNLASAPELTEPRKAKGFFDHTASFFQRSDRALLVGVFQNQPLAHVLAQQCLFSLDVVQFHGSEPIEWASLIPVPVIRRFGPNDPWLSTTGYHSLPLLDSAAGGTGQAIDLAAARRRFDLDPSLRVILAGGLKAESVHDVLVQLGRHRANVLALDVSSGVETNGIQDITKITEFVAAVKRK